MLFREMNLLPEILRAVEEVGYAEATDIQAGAIPLILEGKDLIGRSSTGTEKTARLPSPPFRWSLSAARKGAGYSAKSGHGSGKKCYYGPDSG